MTVIRFEHVTKSYPKYHHLLAGLKSTLLSFPETFRALRHDRFLALDDVSFAVEHGETVGLVGANGSGKSTTLALLAGVLRPQSGRIEVHGRVAPLLELGAGFHPELTGIENIFLNGVLLGLTRKEIIAKMQDIIAFSELGQFLEQPIRTYSSGMLARLGFSVAVHLDPDILLIDEILAVGDLHFQAKCRKKINEFKQRKVTIVLVSHASEEIRNLCDRVIWLHQGKVLGDGTPGEILSRYEEAIQAS